MDHAVSSLILSQFLSFFLDPLRPEAPGSLETCHVTFGRQCSVRRSKRGGWGGAMEMQKNSTAHNLQQQQQQHFSSQPLGDVTGFSCTRQTAAHPQLAQAGTPERAPPLMSKQQNAKDPANKKIFPWMKESRHSDEKSGRRIAGLCDTKSERPFSFLTPSETSACVFVRKTNEKI